MTKTLDNGIERDMTPDEEAEMVARGTTAPTQQQYADAIQGMLDAKARERRYDNILSACTYVHSTDTKFQAEGLACLTWRDAVWAMACGLMEQVAGGQIAAPTIPALLAMLPTMTWPDEA